MDMTLRVHVFWGHVILGVSVMQSNTNKQTISAWKHSSPVFHYRLTHAPATQLWLHHVHHVMFSVTRPVPTADFKHSSNRLFANAVADRISGTQVPSLTRKSVISPRIRHAVAMSRLLSPKRRNMKPSADDFRSSVGGAGANNTTRENELNTTAAGLPNDEQRVEYMPAVQSNERRKVL